MSYMGTAGAAPVPRPEGVYEFAARAVERAHRLLANVEQVARRVRGDVPKDNGVKPTATGPAPLLSLMHELDATLVAVESGMEQLTTALGG